MSGKIRAVSVIGTAITTNQTSPMKRIISALALGVAMPAMLMAQCPQINCPANITVNNDPGNCSAVVNYTLPVATDPCGTGSNTYNFTGGMQSFTVPAGVTAVTIQAWGAQGASNQGGIVGGRGGYATGTLTVTPGDVLNIYVGGQNGYNGGGARGNQVCVAARAGNGGGASDVRLNGVALGNRVIVAGGGGGAGGQRLQACGRGSGGGGGGGYYGGGGGAAWPGIPPGGPVPTGGSQVAGGAGGISTWAALNPGNNGLPGGLGFGGKGGDEVSSNQFGSATAQPGGFGGGLTGQNGLYNSANNWTGQSGAGGSSYITALTGGSTTQNSRTGNGQVIISWSGIGIPVTQIAGLPSGGTFPVGTTTNTYQATNSGITVSCSFTVTVVDNENPNAICQNINAYLNPAGNVTVPASAVNNGSTDNCAIASMSLAPNAFNCTNVGPNGVTLTVTDPTGNTATCNATVTVVDTVSPTVICQNHTVYLNAGGTATITGNDLDGGSSDACGIASRTPSQTNFNCTHLGANTVVLTVTDVNGNSRTCQSTVTVLDTISPVATCQNYTAYLNGAGTVTITGANVDGGSNDPCGGVTLSVAPNTFNCTNIGANTVTLTVTDGSSNTSTCQATVTVVDTISPVATCQPYTAYLNPAGNVTITATNVDGGSSDACGVASVSASPLNFNCTNVGANNVTLTVTDNNSNTSSCVATVTVVDTISPTAICKNHTVYLNPGGTGSMVPADIDGGSTDACGIATLSASQLNFNCNDVGANNVVLTVTDVNGNSSTCTGVVTVVDTVNPNAVCQNINLYLTGLGVANLAGTQIDGGSSDNCAIDTMYASPDFFNCSNRGPNTVWLIVKDQYGNADSCTSTVTVLDTISPNAVCQPFTAYLNAGGTVTITPFDVDGGSTASCGIQSFTVTPNAFNCTNIGANTVTLAITDSSSNTSSCNTTVTVVDTIRPTMVCQNFTAYLNGGGTATITANDIDGGTTDACGIATLTASQTAFNCTHVGPNNVTLIATDVNGNVDSCVAIVTIADTVPPVAACQNFTVYLGATGTATITVPDIDAGSSDNCNVDTIMLSQTAFTCNDIGTVNVQLTVRDDYGNLDSCTAVVTVSDTIVPVALCQNVSVNLDINGNATITTTQIDAGSTDNCSVASITLSRTAFNCNDIGVQNVTLVVTDPSGNADSCTATVTVLDSISPNIICPVDQNVQTDPSCVVTVEDYRSLATSNGDNCAGSNPVITQTPAPGTTVTAANGQFTVWLFIDDGISRDSCDFVVFVDCIAPLFVPEFISPNNDGKNDAFVISGLEAYPNNNIQIFNRWGNVVFKMAQYDNSWDGTSQHGMTIGSGKLPSGAYFYILDLGDGSKPVRGYVEIQR